jgi:hypothetical protein
MRNIIITLSDKFKFKDCVNLLKAKYGCDITKEVEILGMVYATVDETHYQKLIKTSAQFILNVEMDRDNEYF